MSRPTGRLLLKGVCYGFVGKVSHRAAGILHVVTTNKGGSVPTNSVSEAVLCFPVYKS